MWWTVVFILIAPAGFDRADDSLTADSAAHRPVQSLLDDLDDPVWRVRETATESLIERGPALYDAMRVEFANTKSYEARRRMRRIAEEVYVTEAVGPAPAFLGIQRDISSTPDPRIPGNAKSELVRSVITCTAAERGGLRSGDLIVSLNGDWITDSFPAKGFVQWIADQRPGTPCRLGILRGGLGFELRNELQKLTTEQLARIEFDVATQADDPRVPSKGAGILIQRDVEFLDLRTGDLILAIDRKLISAEDAKEAFDTWVRGQSVASDDGESEGPGDKKEGQAEKTEQVRSLHVLRGGEWLKSEVKLGHRPPRVENRRVSETRGNAARDFRIWWRETFDPTGIVGPAGAGKIDADFRRRRPNVERP